MEKSIQNGQSIVVWPGHNLHKDINDMIIAGYTVEDIDRILRRNTYTGLMAATRLSEWRKDR